MKIDLHNHTIYSDGLLTPEELVNNAVKNNVNVFALTDHDAVDGCEETYLIAKKNGIKMIKGMEMSTYYKGESVHIVCLFKNNIIPHEIIDYSLKLKEKRRKRCIDMMNKIHDIYGLKIDLDSLLKNSNIITRANMLRNIAKENNLSQEEASKYISKDSKAYIPSTKLSVKDGLEIARKANCLCIFAHPCLIKNQDYVKEILDFGFDGIEVKYPLPENDEMKYRKLAKEYGLFVSAGSDCHGDSTHIDKSRAHGVIGTRYLDEEEFSVIKKLLNMED